MTSDQLRYAGQGPSQSAANILQRVVKTQKQHVSMLKQSYDP